MRLSAGEIRALGFEWPFSPELEAAIQTRWWKVDLDATLKRLETSLAFYEKQLEQMHAFARQWNAPVDEVSDNRDSYGSSRVALTDAIAHVKAIIAARQAR